jgi:hypothetical protein
MDLELTSAQLVDGRSHADPCYIIPIETRRC